MGGDSGGAWDGESSEVGICRNGADIYKTKTDSHFSEVSPKLHRDPVTMDDDSWEILSKKISVSKTDS